MKVDTCVHFNGIQNKTCKIGIVLRELVGGPSLGWATRLPCLAFEPKEGAKAECPKRQLPTAEQVAESKRQTDEYLKRFMIAYSGKVREWRESQGWSKKNRVSASGKVPCEVCGSGEIHLSMASVNGHVWGKCTTDGCVSWME